MSTPSPAWRREAATPVTLDRRAGARYESSLWACCHTDGPPRDANCSGAVRNISAGGLGLVLGHCFRPGADLTVELQTADGKPLRTVRVRVRHATAVAAENARTWLIGCSFETPLSEAELQALLDDPGANPLIDLAAGRFSG